MLTYLRLDAQGRATGYVNMNIISTQPVKGKFISRSETQYLTRKRVLIGSLPEFYACDSMFYYVTARQWIVDVKHTANDERVAESPSSWLSYPLNPAVGDTLAPALFIDTKPGPDGPSTTNYRIVNRKVASTDSVLLPQIGKLDAWKITADIMASRPGLGEGRAYRYATVEEWFVPRLGVVQHIRKNETGLYYKLQLRGYKMP
ncbi:MAG: hypothetical protein MUC87_13865 [Bacteroidia bacterium]|nr:hypothetical protein [Bacteroidia bacterium]